MRKIAVWGVRGFGQVVIKYLLNKGIGIDMLVDNFVEGEVEGIKVKKPLELLRTDGEYDVYIPILYFYSVLEDHVFKSLKADRRFHVYFTHDLIKLYPDLLQSEYAPEVLLYLRGKERFLQDFGNLCYRDYANMFADEKSKNIFTSFYRLLVEGDVSGIPVPEPFQYFPPELGLERHISKNCIIVDVGAYTGDTLEFFHRILKEKQISIDTYIAFEPEEYNFSMLLKKAREINGKIVCIPAGLHNTKGVFKIVSNSVSSHLVDVSSTKGQYVAVFKYDELLPTLRADIVKMDVEGLEKDILMGMERAIGEGRVKVLMVSVYHNPEDMIVIPRLISSMNRKYRFYLRSHSSLFMETVLYAVLED